MAAVGHQYHLQCRRPGLFHWRVIIFHRHHLATRNSVVLASSTASDNIEAEDDKLTHHRGTLAAGRHNADGGHTEYIDKSAASQCRLHLSPPLLMFIIGDGFACRGDILVANVGRRERRC